MARKLSGGEDEAADLFLDISKDNTTEKGGKVRFVELDAEGLGDYFNEKNKNEAEDVGFDAVWVSEALSHFANKKLFFQNAFRVLKTGGGGKLVIADWFRREDLSEKEMESDIQPIERSFFDRFMRSVRWLTHFLI